MKLSGIIDRMERDGTACSINFWAELDGKRTYNRVHVDAELVTANKWTIDTPISVQIQINGVGIEERK